MSRRAKCPQSPRFARCRPWGARLSSRFVRPPGERFRPSVIPVNPITHLLVGWSVATASPDARRVDHACVAAASVVPDLDGLGLLAEVATRDSGHPLLWWSQFHHVLGHNIGAAAVVIVIAFSVTRRWLVAALAAASFHLHLLGDLVGARGPDGAQWPIPYILPFSDAPQLTVPWQWALNAWPNVVLTIGLLAYTFWYAWARGRSPLEFVSLRANEAFVAALRDRVPRVA